MTKVNGLNEVDAISAAIAATEVEIAGDAWGNEDTDKLDASGDRSLESLGEGLEGQHEDEDDEAADTEAEGDGEESENADGEDTEGEGDEDGEGQGEQPEPSQTQRTERQEGRVPPGRLREAAERARQAEAERDQLRRELEEARQAKPAANPEFEALKAQLALLQQQLQPRQAEQKPPEPKKAPDIFEDPTGFVEHITGEFRQELAKRDQQIANTRLEASFQIAHGIHKDTFEKAWDAVNKLDANNPEDRLQVQRIYNSPNPGEALVSWHRQREAIARVGADPAAYEARIREETKAALLKDPELRKQLIAEMRSEASLGDDGSPRTTTRLPKSLTRAGGSNLGAERIDPNALDNSDRAVADAAWR